MHYSWQTTQWQQFDELLQQNRLPHALLISGSHGLGHQDFAQHIIASLLCNERTDNSSDACGHCHSCQLFMAKSHPDHTHIAPEDIGKQIKIEQIRALKAKQTLTGHVAKWKTAIIDPAESMTISAFNSLLKLLEEPEANTLLILLSSNVAKLPMTIISRCQRIHLTQPDEEQALTWLKQRVDLQNDHLKHLLAATLGAPLATLELIESGTADKLVQTSRDFEQIMQGKGNPVTLAKKWHDIDLHIILNYFQLALKSQITEQIKRGDQHQIKHYWSIYDCIIATIKLLSSSHNVNKTLLLEKFLTSVMRATTLEYHD